MPVLTLVLGALITTAAFLVATNKMRNPKLWELVAIQTGSYLFVESLERAVSGHPVWLGVELLLAGLAVQFPVALFVHTIFKNVLVPTVGILRTVNLGIKPVVPKTVAVKTRSAHWACENTIISLTRRGPPAGAITP